MRAGSFALLGPLVLLASVSVGAQQPPPRPAPQPPPSSVPPAPASTAVPNPFAGFRPGPTDLYRSPDGSDRFQIGSRYPAPPPPPIGSFYPGVYSPFGYPYAYPYSGPYETSIAEAYRMSMAESYLQRQRGTERGSLMLQGDAPSGAQVYVDGHYAGLAAEFGVGGGAMNLDAGPHRIELRAAGHETLAFSVMIEPNSVVRYRGEMQPLTPKPVTPAAPPQAAAAPSAAAVVAKNIYVIPNCYAGDKPPSIAMLPKGCDVKKLQTRK